MSNLNTILSRLQNVHPNGKGYTARCPAHDDRTPSLNVTHCEDGKILVHCFGGCPTDAVVKAIGLSMADLMPTNGSSDFNPHRSVPRPILSESGSTTKRLSTAEQALATLETKHGRPTQSWSYENADGCVVGIVARWDRGGAKTFRPVSLHDGKWIVGGMATPRPLFHLQQVRSHPRNEFMFVHEGEKAAEASRSIALPSTTSAHGAKSARGTDWSPLAGHEVVIVPDNDAAGARYAQDVISSLRSLKSPPTVRVLNLPGLPPGGDIVEYIEEQRAIGLGDDVIADTIRALAARAPVVDLADGQPLEWQPFPVQIFPRVVRRFVEEYAKAMNCDAALLALPVLAMLAGCIGVGRRARIKRTWSEPAIVWAGAVRPKYSRGRRRSIWHCFLASRPSAKARWQ